MWKCLAQSKRQTLLQEAAQSLVRSRRREHGIVRGKTCWCNWQSCGVAGKVQLQCGYREEQCWKSAKLELHAKKGWSACKELVVCAGASIGWKNRKPEKCETHHSCTKSCNRVRMPFENTLISVTGVLFASRTHKCNCFLNPQLTSFSLSKTPVRMFWSSHYTWHNGKAVKRWWHSVTLQEQEGSIVLFFT